MLMYAPIVYGLLPEINVFVFVLSYHPYFSAETECAGLLPGDRNAHRAAHHALPGSASPGKPRRFFLGAIHGYGIGAVQREHDDGSPKQTRYSTNPARHVKHLLRRIVVVKLSFNFKLCKSFHELWQLDRFESANPDSQGTFVRSTLP